MDREIRILQLEDEPNDAELVVAHLEGKGLRFSRLLADRRESFEAALREGGWDVVLSDYKLPDFDGMAALGMVRALSEDLPFIFLSGTMGEDLAVESLKAGANDYIMKENLSRLIPAILRAVEESGQKRQRTRLALEKETEIRRNLARMEGIVRLHQYRAHNTQELLDHALEEALLLTGSRFGYIYLYDEELRRFELNSWSRGVMPECAVVDPQTCSELDGTGLWGEAVRRRKALVVNDFASAHPLKKGYPAGHVPLARFMTLPLEVGERIVAVVGLANKEEPYEEADLLQARILMDSVWKMVELQRSRGDRIRLQSAIDQAVEAIVITGRDGAIQYVNPAFSAITGYAHEEAIGKNPRILKSGVQGEVFYRELWETISAGKSWTGRLVNRKKDGTLFTEDATISPVRSEGGEITNFIAVKHDITEHLRLYVENVELAEKFRHAQKLEAVGRLAGGVAHDFNNLLGVILGYAGLALAKVDNSHDLYPFLKEIMAAGQRSAELTRQLLTFARKQAIAPKRLDLNRQIAGGEKMIRPMVGEDVDMRFLLADDLWPVFMDPTQADQIMTNLAVNARDAIRGVGEIRVETGNRKLDSKFCATHPGLAPGDYVRIVFADNGCGMDKATLSRIFEPFFTTKAEGKGTGLGLATVYGIVKQNHGYIDVRSRPGAGTTFEIFIPRLAGGEDAGETEPQETSALTGTETVLVVEDERPLLTLCEVMLHALGYKVFLAGDGAEALRLCREAKEPIHLLLTDLVMPGMDGKALTEEVSRMMPGIRVLLMSGYAESVLGDRGLAGLEFVQKPFTLHALSVAVRKALGGAG